MSEKPRPENNEPDRKKADSNSPDNIDRQIAKIRFESTLTKVDKEQLYTIEDLEDLFNLDISVLRDLLKQRTKWQQITGKPLKFKLTEIIGEPLADPNQKIERNYRDKATADYAIQIREILSTDNSGGLTAVQLAKRLNASVTKISNILRGLRQRGLISNIAEGKTTKYTSEE